MQVKDLSFYVNVYFYHSDLLQGSLISWKVCLTQGLFLIFQLEVFRRDKDFRVDQESWCQIQGVLPCVVVQSVLTVAPPVEARQVISYN